MNILITGGTGLIGTALLPVLSDTASRITILSRTVEGRSPHYLNVEYVRWDAKTTAGWGEVVNQADVVLNLAGENLAGKGFFPARWTEERKSSIISSRIDAGKALNEAILSAQNKPFLFIQASAIGYYPTHRDDRVITEGFPAGEDFLSRVSVAWEESTSAVESHGIRRAVIRIGMVLSNQGGALPRLLLPHRFYLGGPFGSGEQWYSWVHIEDVCRAICYLIELPDAAGVYNFTSPNPVKNKTFSRILGQVIRKPSYLPVPAFLFRLAFGEVADVVLKGQRVLPDRLLKSGFQFRFSALDSALQDLTRPQ
jgi:hypothetical protein